MFFLIDALIFLDDNIREKRDPIPPKEGIRHVRSFSYISDITKSIQ